MSGSVSLMSRDGTEVHWVVRTFEGELRSQVAFLTLLGVSEEDNNQISWPLPSNQHFNKQISGYGGGGGSS